MTQQPYKSAEKVREGTIKVPKDLSGRAYFDQAPPVIGEIVELVVNGQAYRQEAMSILADTVRALKRAAKRASVAEGFERVEIKRLNGETIEMSARLLCSDEYETRGRDPIRIRMEVWEAEKGHWVAVEVTDRLMAGTTARTTAIVVEPGDDAIARRREVMAFFDWSDRARSMVRKQLDWSLRLDL